MKIQTDAVRERIAQIETMQDGEYLSVAADVVTDMLGGQVELLEEDMNRLLADVKKATAGLSHEALELTVCSSVETSQDRFLPKNR